MQLNPLPAAGVSPAPDTPRVPPANALARPTFDAFLNARVQQPPEKSAEHASDDANRTVTAFKLLLGGVGYGVAMTLLFGSPPGVAIGLSLALAWAQDKLTQKLMKGEGGFSKKLVAACGKLVGAKGHDHKQEDRCIASVWGAITTVTLLGEALVNYMLGKKAKTPAEIQQKLATNIAKGDLWKPVYQLQMKGVQAKEAAVQWIRRLPVFTTGFAAMSQNRIMQFIRRHKKPIGLLALIPLTWLGGYIQGMMALKLAHRVQAKQASKT